jgi:hypothetical protein
VLKIIDPLDRLQNYSRTLQVYFLNLQALAETDAPARTSVAVAELSESINIANEGMNEKDEVAIADTQKRALEELSKSVTRGVQAVQLNNALRRDAPIIGEQLLLHEEVLRKVSGILKHTFDKSMALLKKNEVYRPYVTKTISNKQKWIDTRKRILTGTFFHQGLDNAVEASQKMQIVWSGLVEGKEDLASIQLIIDDIREFTLLVQRLREAAESEGSSNEQ